VVDHFPEERSLSFARRLLLRRADVLAAPSPSGAQRLKNTVGGKSVAVLTNPVIMPNGLEGPPKHPWYQERAEGSREHLLLCSVGNLIPRKGQDVLVRTLERLPDARLVCVGRFDDPAYLDHVKRLASDLGVEDRVSFTGYQPDAPSYMRYADVFVNASNRETAPLVLVEAMAVGVPVVATDCPVGPADLLDHGKAGLLVPCNDPPSMAAAVERLCTNEELRGNLIEAGRRRATEFGVTQAVERYLAVVPPLKPAEAPP
jgi:glycosyltransferase involved in cell wall biosynthesis